MKYNRESFIGNLFFSMTMHYNYEKFWKMRDAVVENSPRTNKLVRLIYLVRLKKMEAYNAASYGTAFGAGAHFETHPITPHGITGSFISHTAVIGKNCVIMQNVTIGSSKKKAPHIGDNCIIGAGAVIIGGVHIGNNVHIGAGCVVAKDVPDNCTIVCAEPRIIQREESDEESTENWIF